MITNLAIEDDLIEQARRIGNHKSHNEAIIEALTEYIQRRNQLKITELFGQIDFDPEYDYKKQRKQL